MNSNSLFSLLLTANKVVWIFTSWERGNQINPWPSAMWLISSKQHNPFIPPDAGMVLSCGGAGTGLLGCLKRFPSLLDQFWWLGCAAVGLVTKVKTIKIMSLH